MIIDVSTAYDQWARFDSLPGAADIARLAGSLEAHDVESGSQGARSAV